VGNTEFGFPQLKSLLEKGHKVVAVFTSPDSTKGFERLCARHGLDLFRTADINAEAARIKKYRPDFLIELGWSQMFKKEILDSFTCVGMHPALLPRRRGRAPITWAILEGLKETGVTLFYLDKGVDSGEIIYQEPVKIKPQATSLWLIKAVNKVLAKMVDRFLRNYPRTPRLRQEHNLATYTLKRNPDDGRISADMDADTWDRHLRALTPPVYPPPFFENKHGDRLYILKGRVEKRRAR
jgi:methionyl-tRNA formyltransferase